jgi:hypothetical protein
MNAGDDRSRTVDLRRPRNPRASDAGSSSERLVRAHAAGRGGPGASELAHLIDRLVAGERDVLGDLPAFAGLTRADVADAVRAVWGSEPATPNIDPQHSLAAASRAGARLAQVATAQRPIVFATASPASLLTLHQQLARLARAGGAPVPDSVDAPPVRIDGRMGRHLRWLGGVAAVTDGESLFATSDRAAGREWAGRFGRPALAVADGPFALSAIARGIPTIVFVDLRSLAAGVAAHAGADVVPVPVHFGVAPAAYEPVADVIGAAFAASVPAAVSHATNAPSGIGS